MKKTTKNLSNVIKQYIPTAQTIAEAYAEDEAMILQVCEELDCNRDEIILTRLEIKQLMKYVEKDTPINITMMDFTDTTMEDELCKLNSRY